MKRETINPYVEAMAFIKNRLTFDVNPARFTHYRKLKKIKNTQSGKKCVIICNGPSLKDVDFNSIKDAKVFTIGLNKINLLFDKLPFRPDIIVAINEHVIEQNINFFAETEIPLFLEFIALKRVAKLDAVTARKNLNLIYATDISNRFARDVSISVCPGFTVTYVAMQIAFHLGFTEVAVIGCDHNFTSKGEANKLISQEGVEENHFIPNYFPPGAKWQLPDLLGSEFHYQIARDTYNEHGRLLVNSTVGGNLDLLARVPLSDFLKPEFRSTSNGK